MMQPQSVIPAHSTNPNRNSRQPRSLSDRLRLEIFHRSDREFLPAALEILERPPSPVSTLFAATLVTMIVSTLIWSVVSFTDIVAIAPGKIQPSGRVKTVQSLETGRVSDIHVRNGDKVKAGDVLISLDERDARAEYDFLVTSYQDALAESVRHDASVRAVDQSEIPPIDWPKEIPPEIGQREYTVFQSDIAMLRATLLSIDAAIEQKKAERERLENVIAAQDALVEIVKERVTMRNTLAETGSGSKSNLIDARETLGHLLSDLENAHGQLQESLRSADAMRADQEKARATFIADHMAKFSAARRDVDGLIPRIRKAKARLDNMQIISPIDGVIAALGVTNNGQVLSGGQEIMRVVPDGAALEAEIYLQNKDVGFVHIGQEVAIKIDAFPFTRYGIVKASVVRVATDAVPQPELLQGETDPAHPLDSKNVAGTQRVQNLVYPVIISFDHPTILIDGKDVPLSVGMSLTAEIKTGRRRLIDYILSPIREVTSESMRER